MKYKKVAESLVDFLKEKYPTVSFNQKTPKSLWIEFSEFGSFLYVNYSREYKNNNGWYGLEESIYNKIIQANNSFIAVILGTPERTFIFPKKKIIEIFNDENKLESKDRPRWMFSIFNENNKYLLKIKKENIDVNDYLNRWNLIPDLKDKKTEENHRNFFLIQVSKFGSENILNNLTYEHSDWKLNQRDYDHGKVKMGDYLLVYFSGNAIDFKQQLKKIYRVDFISKDNIQFKLYEVKDLNGITLKKIQEAIDNKILPKTFINLGLQGFNIAKIDKSEYDSILLLDNKLAQNTSKEPNLWLIRAGDTGQGEQTALAKNCIGIGYDGLPELHMIKDFEVFKEHYKKTHPNDKNNRVGKVVPQIWDFMYEVKIGDFVVLPLKISKSKLVAVGKIVGDYQYADLNSEIQQFRPIHWLKKDVVRNEFDSEIIESFDAQGTVHYVGGLSVVNKVKDMLKRLGVDEIDLESINKVNKELIQYPSIKSDDNIKNKWLSLNDTDIQSIIEKVLTAENKRLEIDENIIKRIISHLIISKHVILVGPPGTGKTDLARRLLRELGNKITGNPEPIEAVASYEWGRYEVIGGRSIISNEGEGSFHFGCVTNAINQKRFLLIDEFNRADMNKAFGEMFLALDHGIIQLREDEYISGFDNNSKKIQIPMDFRMICTMNDYDKSLLNELSYGLLRRFAFVEISVPNNKEKVKNIVKERTYKKLEGLDSNLLSINNKKVDQFINKFIDFMFALKPKREIGLSSYIDVVSFLMYSTTIMKTEPGSALNDSLIDYILPQFDRLDLITLRLAYENASKIFQDETGKTIEYTNPFLLNLEERIKKLEDLDKLFKFGEVV